MKIMLTGKPKVFTMVIPWEGKMYIYKITNKINGKIYIGLTSVEISERFQQHKNCAIRHDNDYPLYASMRKYGIENFIIECVEECPDRKTLGDREKYYIKLYNSTDPTVGYNQSAGGEQNEGDSNPRHCLTEKDVIQIRAEYAKCDKFIRDVYLLYSDKISFSAFEKIWQGVTWQHVNMDVYTPENTRYHKEEGRKLKGENNPFAKSSDYQILLARVYYVNHTLQETYEKYGKVNNYSLHGFRRALTSSYSHLPIYKKVQKIWILNNKEINIHDYQPVSTILESEE